MFLTELGDRVPDWIWPHLTGKAPASPEVKEFVGADDDAAHLDEFERVVSSGVAQADERLHSVESKLQSLASLTSVLSAVVTASMIAVSALYAGVPPIRVPVGIAVLLVSYAAVQLLGSVWAAVRGLMRKGYKQLTLGGAVWQAGETHESYRAGILNRRANHVLYNEWVTSQKVSDMAVAHEGLRNGLMTTGVLICAAAVVAVARLLQP